MRRWTSVAACGLILTLGAQWVVAPAIAAPSERQDGPVEVQGQSSANGAVLLTAEPGWYRSKAPGLDETLHYQVERTTPKSTLTAGVITRPAEPMDYAQVELALSTVDGTQCDSDDTWYTDSSSPRDLMDASVSDAVGGENAAEKRRCARASRFILTVSQDDGLESGNDELAGTGMDIVVNEEPPATNVSELPKAGNPPDWVPPSSSGRTKTVGAKHPLRAEPLDPGSYRTTIASGEQRFFRIDLDWGQALQAHVRVPPPPKKARGPIEADSWQRLDGQLLGPTFGNPRVRGEEIDEDLNHASLSATGSSELRTFTTRVRYRGRDAEPSSTRKASTAGPYYLVLTLTDSDQKYELPVDLELSTRGSVEEPPAYRDGADPIGPTLGDVASNRDRTAFWLLGGGLGLFLLGAGTLTVSSIRSAVGSRATVRT